MASDPRERPATQTSAPVKPARTTEDVAPRRPPEDVPRSDRSATGDDARGDRMPKGADEPGAGL